MNKKAFGFYASVLTAILAAAALVVTLLYRSRGGIVADYAVYALAAVIVCEFLSFFGEKPWTDFTSIAGVALLTYAFMRVLGDGIWNIAEAINGIKMVGLPELADMNYLMAGLELAGILLALLACFTKKSKAV